MVFEAIVYNQQWGHPTNSAYSSDDLKKLTVFDLKSVRRPISAHREVYHRLDQQKFQCKIVNIFLSIILAYILGAH